MRRIVPALCGLVVMLGAFLVVVTTSDRAGPVLVSFRGGHGVHLYDLGVLAVGSTVAGIVWRAVRQLLRR